MLRHPHGFSLVRLTRRADRHLKKETLQLEVVPFSRLSPSALAPLRSLSVAWEELACARRSAGTLRALLTVLRHSYGPPALAARPLPPLTHHRDVRPWINDPTAVRQLLLELRPYWDLAQVADLHPLPLPHAGFVADPFVHRLLGTVEDISETALTPLHVPLLLQAMPRHHSTRDFKVARELLCQIPLDLTTESTALIVHSLHHGPAWLKLLHDPSCHDHAWQILRLAHDTGLLSRPFPKDMVHLVRYLKQTRQSDWAQAFSLITKGLTPRSVVGWLRLRAHYPGIAPAKETAPHQPCYRTLRRVLDILAPRSEKAARTVNEVADRLWEASRQLEGFSAVLHNLRPAWWHEERFALFINMLAGIWDWRSHLPDLARARWTLLRPALPRLIATVEQVHPRWRRKAIELCTDLLVGTGMQVTPELVAVTPDLIRTLCAAPFAGSDDVSVPLALLFRRLPSSHLVAISRNRPFLTRLEKASRTSHHLHWLEEGCRSLDEVPARLYLDILTQCPGKFISALRGLGILPEHARRETWQMFQEHPLVSCQPFTLSPDRLFPLLDAIADKEEAPVPVKLREHHQGTVRLADHVLAHYHEALRQNVIAMQARLLLQLIECALRRTFPALRRTHPLDVHTLMVVRSQRLQRRALNRHLRHLAASPGAPLLPDQANHGWLETLSPRLRQRWLDGFEVERTLPKEGCVRIGPEVDLQEKMKLGTYVGSCLSPGGLCGYSAFTVALDANKLVLYARNADRKVIARQLVTISTDSQLVCFYVYPTNASRDLQDFFEAYDLTLAQYLGLPLNRGCDYEVAELHGLDWWDDGALRLSA